MRTYIRVKFSNLSTNIKIFISRVIFKIKRNLQNEILKFKTRWYARDFEQSYDINFHETYVFVVKSMSYKVLFVIVAKKNLNAKQMNIIIVFLNFMLKKRIYIWSFENYEKTNWIWLLRRVLYKLKQFFKEWYQTLNEFLISQNFICLKFDHSIFVNKKIKLIVSIYVDDLLIIESKKFKKIDKLKRALSKRFVMIDLNFCYHYLNMTMTRDRFKKTLHLSQKIYIEKIIERFDINICKTFAISLKTSTKLKFDAKYKITIKKIKIYQAIVEYLIYLVFQTRFDIVFAI